MYWCHCYVVSIIHETADTIGNRIISEYFFSRLHTFNVRIQVNAQATALACSHTHACTHTSSTYQLDSTRMCPVSVSRSERSVITWRHVWLWILLWLLVLSPLLLLLLFDFNRFRRIKLDIVLYNSHTHAHARTHTYRNQSCISTWMRWL